MKKTILAISMATVMASATAQASDLVTISTGTEGGGYWTKGLNVASALKRKKVGSQVIPSNGSVENIERMNDGEADVIIAQADALNLHPIDVPHRARTAGSEYIMWIYNTKLGYTDIENIEGKTDVRMVLIADSGSTVTMQSFVQEDAGYKPNFQKAIIADDFYAAAEIVADGKYKGSKVAGLLYVGSKVPTGDDGVTDFVNQLGVGEATDGDFNDAEDVNGEPLYTNCTIPKKLMGGLKGATWTEPDTVCVNAMIVANTEHPLYKKEIKRAINKVVKAYQ